MILQAQLESCTLWLNYFFVQNKWRGNSFEVAIFALKSRHTTSRKLFGVKNENSTDFESCLNVWQHRTCEHKIERCHSVPEVGVCSVFSSKKSSK